MDQAFILDSCPANEHSFTHLINRAHRGGKRGEVKRFVFEHILVWMTVLGVGVGIYTAVRWSSLPVLARADGLFFCFLILHLWEETKYPGGFTAMITTKLHFTQADPNFGAIVTSALVLLIAFIPLFFPHVAFLTVVPLLLGILEPLAHLAAIRMSDTRFYSPGLATAVVLLLPTALYGIVYVAQYDLLYPIEWVLCVVYLLVALLVAQQVVVRASGMKYSEFLKNARGALLGRQGSTG